MKKILATLLFVGSTSAVMAADPLTEVDTTENHAASAAAAREFQPLEFTYILEEDTGKEGVRDMLVRFESTHDHIANTDSLRLIRENTLLDIKFFNDYTKPAGSKRDLLMQFSQFPDVLRKNSVVSKGYRIKHSFYLKHGDDLSTLKLETSEPSGDSVRVLVKNIEFTKNPKLPVNAGVADAAQTICDDILPQVFARDTNDAHMGLDDITKLFGSSYIGREDTNKEGEVGKARTSVEFRAQKAKEAFDLLHEAYLDRDIQ